MVVVVVVVVVVVSVTVVVVVEDVGVVVGEVVVVEVGVVVGVVRWHVSNEPSSNEEMALFKAFAVLLQPDADAPLSVPEKVHCTERLFRSPRVNSCAAVLATCATAEQPSLTTRLAVVPETFLHCVGACHLTSRMHAHTH